MKSEGMERIRGMLGLAMRAGKVIVGTEMICRAMPKKGGAPKLVLISKSASPATRGKLSAKSEFYGIEWIEVDIDTEKLGKLLGKTYTPAAAAITDCGFAKEIIEAHRALNQQ